MQEQERPNKGLERGAVWAMFGGLGILAIIAVLSARSGPAPQAVGGKESRNQAQVGEEKIKAEFDAEFNAMASGAHLEQIKRYATTDLPREYHVAEAKRHLAAIPESAPEHKKGEALTKALIAKVAKAKTQEGVGKRGVFAKLYEKQMLDRRLESTVTAEGKDSTTLKINWVMANKVEAHALEKERVFWEQVIGLGFDRVVMTDGFRSFTWDHLQERNRN